MKKTYTGGNPPLIAIEKQIIGYFRKNPRKEISVNRITQALGINTGKDFVQTAMSGLVKKGLIHKLGDGRYSFQKNTPEKKLTHGTFIEGNVDMTQHGGAFIVTGQAGKDIYVPQSKINGALDNDLVKVKLNQHKRGRPEGEIVHVLQRAAESFIGTLEIKKHFGVVITKLNNLELIVYPENFNSAESGDYVVVKVTEWPSARKPRAVAAVTSKLGKLGDSEFAMNEILINQGFDITFPEDVLKEVQSISGDISAEEVSKRRDFRGITTFTIDPINAKDFDDAISIQILDQGMIEVGVHIADVTHFVKTGTALDKEAYHRSTSVYLVDRVCPMLPERLSNELCSLRPNEDKYCFSAVFIFNKEFEIKNTWIGKTIIHSDHRFTYEGAQEVIEGKSEGPFADELKWLNTIALQLRKEKFKNGAINFDSDEIQFELDETGKPIGVYIKERKEAHLLIEDFMLLANKEVARFVSTKDKIEIPMIYRIHDLPDLDKLEQLSIFALQFGIKLDFQSPKKITESLELLSKSTIKDDRLKLLEPLAIKSMAKAEYSSNNIGHYGLAFQYYSHFTSPIRRYSDVLCHRILFDNLNTILRHDKENLEAQCKHVSKQERKAMDAERQSIKYKQVEYLQSHIGEVFDGIISGMNERGLFVEMKSNRCEGFVPFETLEENFIMEPSKLRAVGKKSAEMIQLGDTCQVMVKQTNLAKRQTELKWMGSIK